MLAGTLCAGGSLLLFLFGVLHGVPLGNLTRDLAVIANQHIYYGVLSSLGIMLWASAVAVWLFGAFLLRGKGTRRTTFQFFLATAAFTFILMMDDAFMIHDVVFPGYLHLNEKVLYVGYLMGMLFYLWRFTRQILESEYLFFFVALICFALSMGMDALLPFSEGEAFLEDCFKFAGIAFWLLFPVTTIPRVVEKAIASARSKGDRSTTP